MATFTFPVTITIEPDLQGTATAQDAYNVLDRAIQGVIKSPSRQEVKVVTFSIDDEIDGKTD